MKSFNKTESHFLICGVFFVSKGNLFYFYSFKGTQHVLGIWVADFCISTAMCVCVCVCVFSVSLGFIDYDAI